MNCWKGFTVIDVHKRLSNSTFCKTMHLTEIFFSVYDVHLHKDFATGKLTVYFPLSKKRSAKGKHMFSCSNDSNASVKVPWEHEFTTWILFDPTTFSFFIVNKKKGNQSSISLFCVGKSFFFLHRSLQLGWRRRWNFNYFRL